MRIAELNDPELRRALRAGQLGVEVGPFTISLQSRIPRLAGFVSRMYGEFGCAVDPDYADAVLGIQSVSAGWPRRRERVAISISGQEVISGLQPELLPAILEWGMNAAISACSDDYIVIHAGLVARDGVALLIPAASGSGKSTLTAGLALAGCRLLSDELAVLDLQAGRFVGLARPISLKNESIDVIRKFSSRAEFINTYGRANELSHRSHKGNLAYLRPTRNWIDQAREPVALRSVVFVQYDPEASECELSPVPPAEALFQVASNANLQLAGESGFQRLADVLDPCDSFSLHYSNLHAAVDRLSAKMFAPAVSP